MKIDIVIQGGIWENTYLTALSYLSLDFVNKIIISTWDYEKAKCDLYPSNDRIKYVFSTPPEHDGGGNVNYQIVSSSEGIKKCNTPTVVKMRSDQTIILEDMEKLNRFYTKFHEGNEIFVLGLGTHHPYHPQDHVFWGNREDVETLFTIPLSTWPSYTNVNFRTTHLRSPLYLGAYYYSTFSEVAKEHFTNPKEYLLDDANKRSEAFEEYNKIKYSGFKPFPRINMSWHKYGGGYLYDGYYAQGERYFDTEWE